MDKKDELLLLIAVSGELPADWIGKAAGSESYGAALLTRLKREGLIKLRSKDGIRGYLLRSKGKGEVQKNYPEMAELYLTGSSSTNHVKSEPEKRLRLHRMSMVWVYLYRAGIRVFPGEKPPLFPAPHPSCQKKQEKDFENTSCYYGTMEWKLSTDMEIKGSRVCGVLAADSAYLVYNTMNSLMRWTPKIERNVKSRMEFRFLRYDRRNLSGAIVAGMGLELLSRLLSSDGGVKGNLFQVDDVYERIYYLPLIEEARLQLRLLCDLEALTRFLRFLNSSLKQQAENSLEQEAGRDLSGRRVYYCFLLELWQLKRILMRRREPGDRIFCFTYQAQILKELFGVGTSIEAIHLDKVKKYLGWDC